MSEWVTAKKFHERTGLSMTAIYAREGWPQGQVWAKVGGRIHYNIEGYNQWFSSQVSVRPVKNQSKSTSTTKGKGVEKELSFLQRMETLGAQL